MKFLYSIFIIVLLMANGAWGQNGTVTGKVTDAGGLPLPGATVFEKNNTSNAIQTKKDGTYSINIGNTNGVLVFTFVGYLTKETTVGNKKIIDISLETDAKGLEDVVVVGYGTQKKITKTGAISSVSGSEIRQTPAASLQNTLVGKLPGFTAQVRSGRPGNDGAAFYVRGISTFNGSGQPLILVDDIEYTYNQFSRLDANEVETITVLKDASTTAIYGIKGANGVVLVTTRRGKAGSAKVTFNNQTALSSPTKRRELLNAYQVALLRNEAAQNDFGAPITLPADSVRFGLFSPADLAAFRDHTDPYGHPDVDWYDEIFKNQSLMNTSNIDVSGGNDRLKYFISGGYLFQDGILRHYETDDDFNNNFYYKRYNFRSNLDIQATKSLAFKVNLAGSFGETNQPLFNSTTGDVFGEINSFSHLPPYSYPIFNPDGSYGYGSKYTGGQNNIIGRLSRTGYNRTFENILNLNMTAIQNLDIITKGLSARGTLAYATSNTATRELRRGDNFPSYIYNPTNNTYILRNSNDTRIPLLGLTSNNGSPVRKLNLQAILNYNRTFGSHTVNALALFNQTSDVAANTDVTLNNLPAKFRGYTFRVGYDYKQRYLLEFNGAYNGTDRFQSSKRFGFFPAISAGWNIAEEGFVKNNIGFVDLFKLRGSWGTVGSDDIGSYRYIYQQIYTQTNGNYNFGESPNAVNGIFEGQIGNNDVQWEKERKLNFGLDFSFFKGKLSGTVDVFDNYRYDILATRSRVPLIFGQTLPVQNVGEVSNKGFEIAINHQGKISEELGYNVKGTYSVAKNKILFMDEPQLLLPWKQRTGKPIGLSSAGLYIFDGFYQDQNDVNNSPKPTAGGVIPGSLKYQDLNGDGVITADDQAVTGSPNLPQITYGFGGGVTYKNFSLSFLFQGAKDFSFSMRSEAIDAFLANLQPIHLGRWQPGSGNDAAYPVLRLNSAGLNSARDYPSTFWNVEAWYLRLRSAEFSYTLPSSLTNRLKLDNVRFYISGSNLITWSNVFKRYGFDPESDTGGPGNIYPQQKIINFGVQVSFK